MYSNACTVLPARPVQIKWPRTPPTHTPATSLIPAITIVASWDLNNHAINHAINQSYNQSTNQSLHQSKTNPINQSFFIYLFYVHDIEPFNLKVQSLLSVTPLKSMTLLQDINNLLLINYRLKIKITHFWC